MVTDTFIIPGLYGSDATHWQSRWEKLYGFKRVMQRDWNKPVFSQWQNSLCEFLAGNRSEGDYFLVVHSLGCHLVAQSLPLISSGLKGVFMVAPPDLEKGSIDRDLSSFAPKEIQRADVAGYLVYSENDPHASPSFSEHFAAQLSIAPINIGRCGHINSDSNLGNWDDGFRLFQRLVKEIASTSIK